MPELKPETESNEAPSADEKPKEAPRELGTWCSLDEDARWLFVEEAKLRSFELADDSFDDQGGRVIEVEGEHISDLSSFFCAFGEAVNGPGGHFGDTLGEFDGSLFGGCGLESPFEIRWLNSAKSANAFDSSALAKVCKDAIDNELYADEGGHTQLTEMLKQAEAGELSFFDNIVNGIRSVNERSDGEISIKLSLL